MKHLHGFPFSGIYAITDSGLKGDDIASQVARAIEGGARVVQYRDKSTDNSLREQEARAILGTCRARGVPLLINDDIELAKRIGADGVHLGREDGALADARERLGSGAIIGVSCYNQLALAQDAEAAGADYVAFGRFFSSQSKPLAVQADPQLLQQASRTLRCPVVAIGGISTDNGARLIQAGADMLAVIRGIFAADDITQATRSLQLLFNERTQETP